MLNFFMDLIGDAYVTLKDNCCSIHTQWIKTFCILLRVNFNTLCSYLSVFLFWVNVFPLRYLGSIVFFFDITRLSVISPAELTEIYIDGSLESKAFRQAEQIFAFFSMSACSATRKTSRHCPFFYSGVTEM